MTAVVPFPFRTRFPALGGSVAQEFQDLWRRFLGANGGQATVGWEPLVDMLDKPGSYLLQAEVAGLKSADIDVSLSGNVLTISGERKEHQRAEGESCWLCERGYGKFSRSFHLPGEVKGDKVDAELKDGILTVTVQKAAAAKHAKIRVKAS